MRELLTAAAERAIRYLEGLNKRGVTPDPAVFFQDACIRIVCLRHDHRFAQGWQLCGFFYPRDHCIT
jgi:hypothetical protein